MSKYVVVIIDGNEKETFEINSVETKPSGNDPAVIKKEMDENCQGAVEIMVKGRYPNRTFTVGTIDSEVGIIGFYVILDVNRKLKKQFKN